MKKFPSRAGLLICLSAFLPHAGQAQLRLACLFTDHMVLQRSQPVPVWGSAAPNAKVVVRINRQEKNARADRAGNWTVSLDPQPAGGPYSLTVVTGKDSVTLEDVLVGEVWLCSGQSNMEFSVSQATDAAATIRAADNPQIRSFTVPKNVSLAPQEVIEPASWQLCNPETVGKFTAVGYFFAREIQERLHVPVGIIHSSWGGTMVETWISKGAFEKSPAFRDMIEALPSNSELGAAEKQKRDQLASKIKSLEADIPDSAAESLWASPSYNDQGWPAMKIPGLWERQGLGLEGLDGVVWFRRTVELSAAQAARAGRLDIGKIDDADETYVNGARVGGTNGYNVERHYTLPAGTFHAGKNTIAVRVTDDGGDGGIYTTGETLKLELGEAAIPLDGAWKYRVARIDSSRGGGMNPNALPTLLFNAMINPLIPYGIRGALWYQGESNAGRAYEYREAFPLLINDWRARWDEGNFPFYFVQLATFNSAGGDSEHGSEWAELREAQTRTLNLPNTGMAVTTDIGDPKDIHPKNKLDVGRRLAAIALNNIYGETMQYSGPVYQSMSIDTPGHRIELEFGHTGSGMVSRDKYGYLRGFEIAGADHKFHFAKASIEGNKVYVWSDAVPEPLEVRYNWADDASDGNLFNQEGFPAGPFRTDQWKGKTEDVHYRISRL